MVKANSGVAAARTCLQCLRGIGAAEFSHGTGRCLRDRLRRRS